MTPRYIALAVTYLIWWCARPRTKALYNIWPNVIKRFLQTDVHVLWQPLWIARWYDEYARGWGSAWRWDWSSSQPGVQPTKCMAGAQGSSGLWPRYTCTLSYFNQMKYSSDVIKKPYIPTNISTAIIHEFRLYPCRYIV